MTKKHSTKKALMASALSLLLCFSMLIGTTFAWFTDSVTSANNIITTGNLDVELYYQVEGQTDWTKVTEDTNVFKKDTLWEPGHTEVVKLKVVNEGTLALKYQLGVNVASEVGSVNVNNEEFKLSDFIKFGIVDGAQTYTRDQAIAAAEANGATALKTAYNSAVTSLEAKNDGNTDEKIVTMVVYMPTTVGNDANYKKGEIVPTVNLGINLFATQMTAENDSFGNNYDEDAPYSLWNGVVPTEMPASLVVDGATQTVHVKDAAAFAYLSTLSAKWAEFYTDGNGREWINYANGAGADYYYSNKWTVSLEADIDLGNYPIAPVDIKLGEATDASAFNGNGHIIRNINATTGLFADGTRATFSNFTLENVKATRGALIGSAKNGITNVTVKNATISGTDYVGGLVGSAYSSVTGCKVIDSSITATGKEAGAMIGYIETSTTATVAYNTVNNVNVYAGNRAAGLVAQVNVNVKVYNNVIDTVTVGAADTTTYQPGAVVSNAIAPENVYDNTVTNANVATKAANATDNVTLNSAIADGADTIFLGSGEYVIPDSAQGKTLTIVGNGDTVVASQDDGAAEGDCDYSFKGSTVTFENVTITTSTTYFPGYAYMKGIYNNCTINGVWTLYDNSEFNNCTFNVTGDVYNVWTWGAAVATFNNCTFNNDGKAILVYGGGNTKLTVNGCTFNDNGGLTSKKAAIEVGSGYGSSFELIINDTVVNGYEINDEGINTGTTLWGNKNSMGTDKLNVVVDGVDVY